MRRIKCFILVVLLAGMLQMGLGQLAQPEFESTSNESVLLRYKFKVSELVKMKIEIGMHMKMSFAGRNIDMPIDMMVEADYVIDSVDSNGDAKIKLLITRMTMDMKGPQGKVAVDTKDSASMQNPQFKPIMAMINTPIFAKLTPLGKVLNLDFNLLRKAMQKMGSAAMSQNLKQQTDQMMNSSFIQLSKDPVAAGDTYEAGKITQTMPNFGILETEVKYKVLKVSGDKKQVILKPMGKMRLIPSPTAR